MNSRKIDILDMLDRNDAVDYKKDRDEAIRTFVETSQEYYVEQFSKIGARSKFTLTFNWFAGLLGPVWFGARGLWSWALAFLIVETIAFVQIQEGHLAIYPRKHGCELHQLKTHLNCDANNLLRR